MCDVRPTRIRRWIAGGVATVVRGVGATCALTRPTHWSATFCRPVLRVSGVDAEALATLHFASPSAVDCVNVSTSAGTLQRCHTVPAPPRVQPSRARWRRRISPAFTRTSSSPSATDPPVSGGPSWRTMRSARWVAPRRSCAASGSATPMRSRARTWARVAFIPSGGRSATAWAEVTAMRRPRCRTRDPSTRPAHAGSDSRPVSLTEHIDVAGGDAAR